MNNIRIALLPLIISAAGFIVLCYADWRIAVGVALMMRGNNLDLMQQWRDRHDER